MRKWPREEQMRRANMLILDGCKGMGKAFLG
jgi:predicted ATPase